MNEKMEEANVARSCNLCGLLSATRLCRKHDSLWHNRIMEACKLLISHLGLSYNCNMNCKHCYSERNEDLLTLADYHRIVDALDEKGLFILYYTYGEPLMSNILWEMLDFVGRKNIFQVLMTNGYLLDKGAAIQLKRAGIANVCISIDHIDPQKHDENRGVIGAFDKAVAAIQNCVENNISVSISTAVNATNVGCLGQIHDFAAAIGAGYVSFLRQRKDGDVVRLTDAEFADYCAFFSNYFCASPQAKDLKVHDTSLLPLIHSLYKQKKIGDNSYQKYIEMNICHAANTISIDPSGKVRRCNLHPKIHGNYFSDTLSDILEKGVCMNACNVCRSAISK